MRLLDLVVLLMCVQIICSHEHIEDHAHAEQSNVKTALAYPCRECWRKLAFPTSCADFNHFWRETIACVTQSNCTALEKGGFSGTCFYYKEYVNIEMILCDTDCWDVFDSIDTPLSHVASSASAAAAPCVKEFTPSNSTKCARKYSEYACYRDLTASFLIGFRAALIHRHVSECNIKRHGYTLKYGGHHYKLYKSREVHGNWNNAKCVCEADGGHLAIDDSLDVHEYLMRNPKNAWKFWIGGREMKFEEKWKFVDGTTPDKKFWMPGEPNDFRGIDEECLLMHQPITRRGKQKENDGGWNDAPCSAPKNFLCEIRETSAIHLDLVQMNEDPATCIYDYTLCSTEYRRVYYVTNRAVLMAAFIINAVLTAVVCVALAYGIIRTGRGKIQENKLILMLVIIDVIQGVVVSSMNAYAVNHVHVTCPFHFARIILAYFSVISSPAVVLAITVYRYLQALRPRLCVGTNSCVVKVVVIFGILVSIIATACISSIFFAWIGLVMVAIYLVSFVAILLAAICLNIAMACKLRRNNRDGIVPTILEESDDTEPVNTNVLGITICCVATLGLMCAYLPVARKLGMDVAAWLQVLMFSMSWIIPAIYLSHDHRIRRVLGITRSKVHRMHYNADLDILTLNIECEAEDDEYTDEPPRDHDTVVT